MRIYTRFTAVQRLEHLVLVVSFTALALTGLPQKYAATGFGEGLLVLLGGIERVRIVHRGAAVILILATIAHGIEVAYRRFVERTPLSMAPRADDVRNALRTFLYNLGRRSDRPRQGRYSFEEKVEYWALVWGTLLMIATGFMLWKPIVTTSLFSGQFIPAARVVHGGEALLAVLAIVVWHGYGVHLRHFNRSMFTGVMTEEEMRKEHPLELEEIEAGRSPAPPEPAARRRRLRIFAPLAAAGAVALLAALWAFLAFSRTAIPTVPRQPPPPRAARSDEAIPNTGR